MTPHVPCSCGLVHCTPQGPTSRTCGIAPLVRPRACHTPCGLGCLLPSCVCLCIMHHRRRRAQRYHAPMCLSCALRYRMRGAASCPTLLLFLFMRPMSGDIGCAAQHYICLSCAHLAIQYAWYSCRCLSVLCNLKWLGCHLWQCKTRVALA